MDVIGNEIKQGQILAYASGKYRTKIGVAKSLGWSSTYNRYVGMYVATGMYDNRLHGCTVNITEYTNTPDVYKIPGIFVVSNPSVELLSEWQPIIDRCVGVAWSREAVKPKADGSKIFHLLTSMKSHYSGYSPSWPKNGSHQKNGYVETTNGQLHVQVVNYSNSDIRVEFTLDKTPLKLEALVLQFNVDPNGLLKRIEALKESMKK